jgi:hypothetical protein
MRVALACMTCIFNSDGEPDHTPVYVEMEGNRILAATCPKGHEIRTVRQEMPFELLLEMGGLALLDGYYREAVSSFAAALERFYEFYVRVVAEGRKVDPAPMVAAWKLMSKQSERQMGAFVICHLMETGTAPLIDPKRVEFRNEVIHKGLFPCPAEARDYARWVFDFIVSTGAKLREAYLEASHRVIARTMGQSFTELHERGMRASTSGIGTLLSWSDGGWSSASFNTAMRRLADRRDLVWARPIPFDWPE